MIPKPDVERIKGTAEDVLTVFVPEYAKQFAIQSMKQKLNESMKKEKPDWKLRTAPTPKKPVKCGWVEKQGDVVKNWKKRFVVLGNEKDDFIAKYYEKGEDDKGSGKPKGEIRLDGYEIKLFDEDELKEFGQFGVKMVPYSKRRRTWRFRFSSEEERDEWKTALNNASRKAPAPLNKDKVLRKTFLSAYRQTRWEMPGWYGPWPGWGGTEAEHLGAMIVDKCDHDFMGEFYAKLPSGFLHNFARNKAVGLLDSTVGTAVKAGWGKCEDQVKELKPKVDSNINEHLDEVAIQHAKLMEEVQKGATSLLEQGLKEIAEPVMKPLADLMIGPIIEGFKQVVKIWKNKMKPGEADLKKSAKEVKRWAWSSYLMSDAWHPVQEFTNSTALQALDSVLRGFNRWRFEWDFRESTETLMRKASYTWKQEVKENGGDEAAATSSVTEKLEHDSRLACTEYIFRILNAIIMEPIEKLILPKLKSEVLHPIENAMPDFLKQLLDLTQMVVKIIKKAVTDAVKNTTLPLLQNRINEISK